MMFILSVRATTLKFAAAVCLGILLVTMLVIFLPDKPEGLPASGEEKIVYENVKSVEDMERFLAQFGWEVDKTPISDREVVLPAKFTGIFAEYNELQKAQNLDLSPYCGKRVRKVLLKVTNHPSGDALAVLFLYRDCVVGGSLSSGSPGGFVCGFEGKYES